MPLASFREANDSTKHLGERYDCNSETVRQALRSAGMIMRAPWERC
jgi:hypothetical protein